MKKHFKRFAALCLAAMLSFPLFHLTASAAQADGQQVDILFLHDTHSHLDSFPTVERM